MTPAQLAQGPVVGLDDHAAGGILDTRPARVSKPDWLPKSGGHELMVALAQVAAERLLWLKQEETLQQMSDVAKHVGGAKIKT